MRMDNGEWGRISPTPPKQRIIVSRCSKRPRVRRVRGAAVARDLGRRLTQDEFRARAQLTEEQLGALDEIAAGRPKRNALSTIKAIETKLAYAYAKPAQVHDLTVKASLESLLAEAVAPQTVPAEGQDSGSAEIVVPGASSEVESVGEMVNGVWVAHDPDEGIGP